MKPEVDLLEKPMPCRTKERPRPLVALTLVFCSLAASGSCSLGRVPGSDTRSGAERGVASDFAFAELRDGSTVTGSINLNGLWQFKATDEDVWMDARVPGTVWTDLLRVDRLEDPFYRDNELRVQWVEKKEWEYRRHFQVDEVFLRHDRILLDCRGLDTIAEIYLNRRQVAKTINMFVEYEYDVKDLLVRGDNVIHIIFRSILEWNKQQMAREPRSAWLSPINTDHSKGNVFFARKEASDFGWDWGIRQLTCGIWRPIRLAAYNTARVVDLGVSQNLADPQRAFLEVNIDIERYKETDLAVQLEVSLEGKSIETRTCPVSGTKVTGTLSIPGARLWWPSGWGEQPLYTVTARLMSGNQAVHQKAVRIGLREVALWRDKDQQGETFGIKINGRLIFCKGANWIPADVLPERLTEAHYRHLLQSCLESNMNMLRVWGGGLYEADVFYEFCDEKGLMLWHDFMFAVGPCLDTPAYLENVRQEISSVVRRLRHHPSIILWCGNNELESALARRAGGRSRELWSSYYRVFHEVIPSTATLHDPDRPYWPSSPHHPLAQDRSRPHWETASGDAHLWDVWHGGKPFSWYAENLDFRFVSEFGFQSLPHMETIRSFTGPEDRHFPSRILDHHNMAGKKEHGTESIGNIRIATYLADMFRMPTSFDNWVYLSQVMHAEGMKVGCEAYRRNFPATTGALYWQVNDNWPTISGSSMDYYGRWKALQYLARHFFNPILVTAQVKETKVSIWAVNDRLEGLSAKLEWRLARFEGQTVKGGEQEVKLPPNSSSLALELDFEKEAGENPEFATYRKHSYRNRGHYYVAYRLRQGERILSSNVSFLVPQKYLELGDPKLTHSIEAEGDASVITVRAEGFAAYVEVGLKHGYARFSDNYFHLLPGESKRVTVFQYDASVEDLATGLYVKSLFDSYRE